MNMCSGQYVSPHLEPRQAYIDTWQPDAACWHCRTVESASYQLASSIVWTALCSLPAATAQLDSCCTLTPVLLCSTGLDILDIALAAGDAFAVIQSIGLAAQCVAFAGDGVAFWSHCIDLASQHTAAAGKQGKLGDLQALQSDPDDAELPWTFPA